MTGTERVSARASGGRRPDGPNAGVVGVVAMVLTIASIVIPALLAGGALLPSPIGSTAAVAAYCTAHRSAVVATGFLMFASSVPLGIYVATTYARLLRLGVRVPGPNIAFVGGISASVLLATAGLLAWAMGQPVAGQSPALLQTLAGAVYAMGGVGCVGGLGLLIAGIAVPGLILELTPRWLAWAGLVLAGIAEISFLALVLPPLAALLPVARFLGLAWLLAVGFLLPRSRHDVVRRDPS